MLNRRLARIALALGLHPRPAVADASGRRNALVAAQQQLGSTVAVMRQDFDALHQQLASLQGALQTLQASLSALHAVQSKRQLQLQAPTLVLTHIPKAGALN